MMILPLLLVAAALQAEMTPQEKKTTGLYKLNKKERSALQIWIEANYGAKVVPPPGTSSKSLLEENLQDGAYIRLKDGSTWQIHPDDTAITSAWITPVDIAVSANDDPSYPYKLTNTLTKSSVRAQKVRNVPSLPDRAVVPPAAPAQPSISGSGKGK